MQPSLLCRLEHIAAFIVVPLWSLLQPSLLCHSNHYCSLYCYIIHLYGWEHELWNGNCKQISNWWRIAEFAAHRYVLSNIFSIFKTFLTNLNSITTPSSIFEALSNKKWKKARDVEMEVLIRTCTLAIGKNQRHVSECYKTRLAAKGFTQTYGMDYLETFLPWLLGWILLE